MKDLDAYKDTPLPEESGSPDTVPAAESELPWDEPYTDPLEDTDRIKRAIEKTVDDETAALPLFAHAEAEEDRPEETFDAEPEAEFQKDALDFTPEPEFAEDDFDFTPEPSRPKKAASPESAPSSPARIHRWFFTFMCMNIPIIGWIYLLYLAFSKKMTDRRDFARAYLFYKLVFLIVSLVILGILLYIGIGLLDQLLAYMQML